MEDDDGTYLACAMQGVLTEWDDRLRLGVILTEDGEQVRISEVVLYLQGFKTIPKVGDCIHFWAERQVTVTYKLKEIRVIEPRQRDDAIIAGLQKRYRDLTLKERLRHHGYVVETRSGTIESFNAKAKTGCVRLDDGELAEIAPHGVRKADCKHLRPGIAVRCKAVHGVGFCLASEIEIVADRER